MRLPSGEIRKVHIDCRATVGQVSNGDHANVSLGKAGRSRWLGRRPHNRGVTMNPVDHPWAAARVGRPAVVTRAPVGPVDKRLQDSEQQANRRDDHPATWNEGLSNASQRQEGSVR